MKQKNLVKHAQLELFPIHILPQQPLPLLVKKEVITVLKNFMLKHGKEKKEASDE